MWAASRSGRWSWGRTMEEDRKGVGKDVGDVGKKPDSNPGLEHLTGKVAQYYGLEESHIKVQWKDD